MRSGLQLPQHWCSLGGELRVSIDEWGVSRPWKEKHGTEGKALVKELRGGVLGWNCMHDGLMD